MEITISDLVLKSESWYGTLNFSQKYIKTCKHQCIQKVDWNSKEVVLTFIFIRKIKASQSHFISVSNRMYQSIINSSYNACKSNCTASNV